MLGYGGWLVLRHMLTPGDVVMFAAYLDRLYSPIDSLNGLAVSLQENLTSLRRAVKLRDSGRWSRPALRLPEGKGRVEFRDVHFGYTPEREVLHGINLTLQPGKITALAGPSGAGKTTTADLLLKLFEPWSGEILLDGQPLSTAGCSSVRAAIGVVASDGTVFRGTLAENIRYKRPQATLEEIREAALAAGLGRALERLPEGLNTEVGEKGVGLSVGERQRLQIARMLIDKPRLLVLDEATANLDYATELDVRTALERNVSQAHDAGDCASLHDDEECRLRLRPEGRRGGRTRDARGTAEGPGLVCGAGAGVGRGPQLRMKLNLKLLKQAAAIAKPYWSSKEGRRSYWLVAAADPAASGGHSIECLVQHASRGNSLRPWPLATGTRFWHSVRVYLLLLLIAVPEYSAYYYARDRVALVWRRSLTQRVLDRYFRNHAFYQLHTEAEIDNPDQRIADDIYSITSQSVNFLLILASAIFQVVAFGRVLWRISGYLILFLVVYATDHHAC